MSGRLRTSSLISLESSITFGRIVLTLKIGLSVEAIPIVVVDVVVVDLGVRGVMATILTPLPALGVDDNAGKEFTTFFLPPFPVGGLGAKSIVGSFGKRLSIVSRPPHVRTQASPDKKLFPLPPHPEYLNFLQAPDSESWKNRMDTVKQVPKSFGSLQTLTDVS